MITLNGGGLQWAPNNTVDVSRRLNPIGAGGATFDTNGNNVTFASPLRGIGGVTKPGAGILALTANNIYRGGTTVTGGLINFQSLGNFGGGMITLNGGGLQWAPGSSVDVSGRLNPIGTGGGTFDVNGNNVTLASALTGAGGVTKQGAGALTLSAVNTYLGGTSIVGGVLAISNDNNLGNPAGALNLANGGTLKTLSMISSSRSGTLGGGGGGFDTNGVDSTLSGVFSRFRVD